ncbi:MAG: hypothetical protein AVO33_02490 [delta proteobacterium ML8_F1]|nr:MAG: hypothetical protein AVO33_02490 [delta proteobacterium ML8_F1]
MLEISSQDKSLIYDLTHLGRIFFEKILWVEEPSGQVPYLEVSQHGDRARIELFSAGRRIFFQEVPGQKNLIKGAAYEGLSRLKPSGSPYGILVGVRPVKLVHQLFDEGFQSDQVEEILNSTFKVSPQKATLLTAIASLERPYVKLDTENLSVYMGIPFCPSICTYCAFPSNDVTRKGHLLKPYMEKLNQEIVYAAGLIKSRALVVDNLYVGGGTPSVIDENLMQNLLGTINDCFDMSQVKEFTFEAGRADTITEEKLRLLKSGGVTRVCLNPQSMDQEVLFAVNRRHEPGAVFQAMEWIQKTGFHSVNMDLIVGLPLDTAEGFKKTLKTVVAMGPENITVHTLSIKKGAGLDPWSLMAPPEISASLKFSAEYLEEKGYKPYYLYRQKNILGNFENIGYTVSDRASLYNIRMMEEQHPVLALGVGGVSKKIHSKDHFDRVQNFRSVEDYLSRFDEVLQKKEQILNLTPEE